VLLAWTEQGNTALVTIPRPKYARVLRAYACDWTWLTSQNKLGVVARIFEGSERAFEFSQSMHFCFPWDPHRNVAGL